MSIFKEASVLGEYQGWKSLFLKEHQVAERFLDDEGHYRYGIFELSSTESNQLEVEVTQEQSGSNLRFAIVNADVIPLEVSKIAAFRNDFDFYLFMAMNPERVTKLREVLQASAAPLILVTELTYN